MAGQGSEGATSLLGLVVGALLFAGVFLAVLQFSLQPSVDAPQAGEATRSVTASSLSDLLLANPGVGWYVGAACQGGTTTIDSSKFTPEVVGRLGLAQESCAINGGGYSRHVNLSYEKLQNLYRAGFEADPTNGYLDYMEARKSLGLDVQHLDFHVRSWPILPDVQAALKSGYMDPYLRPLYIGDYTEQHGGGSGTPTYDVQREAGYTDGANAVDLWVRITNNGTVATAFSVDFVVPAKRDISTEKHTALVAPAQSATVHFYVNKTANWQWKSASVKKFDYVIKDPAKTVGSGTVGLSAVTMSASSNKPIFTAEASALTYAYAGLPVPVNLEYDVLDGAGSSTGSYTGWTIDVRNAANAVVASSSLLNAKGGVFAAALAGPGTYTFNLKAQGGWVAQSDSFQVVSDPIGVFTPAAAPGHWIYEPPVPIEAAYIERLVQNFDIGVPSATYGYGEVPTLAAGDVVPDDNRYLADELPQILSSDGVASTARYNVLLVGTGVDHNSLTSGAVKHSIADWVVAGGTLIVFGSDAQAVQWLEPLFHVALDSAGNGINVPDANHPLLNVPNHLDASSYDAHGSAWHFNGAGDSAYFTHIVLAGSDDVLTVSNPGAFGSGRIVLTAWQPYDLLSGSAPGYCGLSNLTAACPALQVIQNFVSVGYSGLYLDYGPTIPPGSSQGVQSRIATVWHPQLQRQVEIYILVYVFD